MSHQKPYEIQIPAALLDLALPDLLALAGIKPPAEEPRYLRRKYRRRSPRPEDVLIDQPDSAFAQLFFAVSVDMVIRRRGWVGAHIVWGELRRRLSNATHGSLERQALFELIVVKDEAAARKAADKSTR